MFEFYQSRAKEKRKKHRKAIEKKKVKLREAIADCRNKLDNKTGIRNDSYYEGFLDACRWALNEVV